MMKKLIHFPEKLTFSVGILLLAAPAVHAAEPPAPPQVDAKAYILMDYNSGKVLTEGNADTRLDPASLTKIMSSYVIGRDQGRQDQAGRHGHRRQRRPAPGNPALRGSSLMFIKPGDQVPVLELNKGIVIQSVTTPASRWRTTWRAAVIRSSA